MNELQKLQEQRKTLMDKIDNTKTNEELDKAELDLRKLDLIIEKRNINATDQNNGVPPLGEDDTNYLPQKRNQTPGQLNVLGTYEIGSETRKTIISGSTKELKELYEKRGQDLKDKKLVSFEMRELDEFRSVTIAGGELVIPTIESNTLNPTFNQVSSVIDLVNSIPLLKGETYQQGFVVDYGEGSETDENGDYTETDPVMDYVTIGKSKVTAYCEMSEESVKLVNSSYQAEVAKTMRIALRKRISKQIIRGSGAANQITGIFNAPLNVMPIAGDLSIATIDADTLDKIVFNYGGDEDVEGAAYLILNKKDLAVFASIKSTTGEKLYKISLNGNTGTISSSDSYSVHYIINSICPSLTDVATIAGTNCMAYGKLSAYLMPIFSPVDIQESRDFKFKSGQICYKGSVYTGGQVVMYKGFTRIKKQ